MCSKGSVPCTPAQTILFHASQWKHDRCVPSRWNQSTHFRKWSCAVSLILRRVKGDTRASFYDIFVVQWKSCLVTVSNKHKKLNKTTLKSFCTCYCFLCRGCSIPSRTLNFISRSWAILYFSSERHQAKDQAICHHYIINDIELNIKSSDHTLLYCN